MLYQLLGLLPQGDAGSLRYLAAGVVLTVAGLGLSVAGARASRSVFTLAAVAAGAWGGLRIPRWTGWELDAMATAIGAALVLGLSGYLLHRAWVGLTLGLMLAAAGFVVTWHRLVGPETWLMPTIDLAQPATVIVRELWNALPIGWTRVLSIVAGTGLAAGGLLAWVWPKAARVLAFSLLGPVMFVAGALVLVAMKKPEWIVKIPESIQTQGIAMAILVVASTAFQWATFPRVKSPAGSSGFAGANKGRGPRDVRDLGTTPLGPMKLKEVKA